MEWYRFFLLLAGLNRTKMFRRSAARTLAKRPTLLAFHASIAYPTGLAQNPQRISHLARNGAP